MNNKNISFSEKNTIQLSLAFSATPVESSMPLVYNTTSLILENIQLPFTLKDALASTLTQQQKINYPKELCFVPEIITAEHVAEQLTRLPELMKQYSTQAQTILLDTSVGLSTDARTALINSTHNILATPNTHTTEELKTQYHYNKIKRDALNKTTNSLKEKFLSTQILSSSQITRSFTNQSISSIFANSIAKLAQHCLRL